MAGSAGGEPTDIQRLDIWSPHQGLSQPLSHVLSYVCVLVCVHVKEDTLTKNIYSVNFKMCLITHWNRETESWRRNRGRAMVGEGKEGRGKERVVDAY